MEIRWSGGHAGSRRVPGLRRKEAAMLAGAGADYYMQLEKGSLSATFTRPTRADRSLGVRVGTREAFSKAACASVSEAGELNPRR